jgi:hypothetical protein
MQQLLELKTRPRFFPIKWSSFIAYLRAIGMCGFALQLLSAIMWAYLTVQETPKRLFNIQGWQIYYKICWVNKPRTKLRSNLSL